MAVAYCFWCSHLRILCFYFGYNKVGLHISNFEVIAFEIINKLK